jgi:hypothetical protein
MRTCIAVIPINKLIQRVLVLLQAHLAWKVRFRQLKKGRKPVNYSPAAIVTVTSEPIDE